MTVYEYFQDQATHNRACSRKAETRSMSESFLADAEKWERRAGLLTTEIGSKDIDEVILWRVIEQVDREANQKKETR